MPTVEIVAKQRYSNGEEIRNTFHIDGGVVGPTQINSAIALLEAEYAALAGFLWSGWQLYEFAWRNLSVAQMPSIPVALAAPVVGTAPGDLTTFTAAALISFRSATPPPNRSRKYIAGITEGFVTGGYPTQQFRDGLQGFVDALLDHNAAIVDPTDAYYWGVARVDPVTGIAVAFNAYESGSAPTQLGTMRSRDGR